MDYDVHEDEEFYMVIHELNMVQYRYTFEFLYDSLYWLYLKVKGWL